MTILPVVNITLTSVESKSVMAYSPAILWLVVKAKVTSAKSKTFSRLFPSLNSGWWRR